MKTQNIFPHFKRIATVATLLLLTSLLQLAFSVKSKNAHTYIIRQADLFLQKLTELNSKATKFRHGQLGADQLQQAVADSRIAYKTLEEVVEFYNTGGGLGYGLEVPNQTLSGDSLHLSDTEKADLIAFMKSL